MTDHGIRPKAWGVLAVSLALMALVAALSSTTEHQPAASSTPAASTASPAGAVSRSEPLHRHPSTGGTGRSSYGSVTAPDRHAAISQHLARHEGRPIHRRIGPPTAGRERPSVHLASTPALGTLAGAGTGTTGVGAGISPVSPSVPSGTPGDTGGTGDARAATSDGSPSTTAPSATTGTSGTMGTTGTSGTTGTTGTAGTTGSHHHGTIAFPATSATVSAPGGSAVNATATWSGTPTLQLTITCPDGVSASRRGTSGLSLEVNDTAGGTGSCDVQLATPPSVRADVDFTLTVEPAG